MRVCGDVQLAGGRVSGGRAPSGGERQRSESSEGATELGFPGPTLGQMQSEAARRAGEPSGHGKEAACMGPRSKPASNGWRELLTEVVPRGPSCLGTGRGLHARTERIKMREWLARWMSDCVVGYLSQATQDRYGGIIKNHLNPAARTDMAWVISNCGSCLLGTSRQCNRNYCRVEWIPQA